MSSKNCVRSLLLTKRRNSKSSEEKDESEVSAKPSMVENTTTTKPSESGDGEHREDLETSVPVHPKAEKKDEDSDDDLFATDEGGEPSAKHSNAEIHLDAPNPTGEAVESVPPSGAAAPAPVTATASAPTSSRSESIPRKQSEAKKSLVPADASISHFNPDNAATKYGLSAGVIIPPSVSGELLKGKLLETLQSLPVNLINDALTEYDDAVAIKGAAIRNHGAYLFGVAKRYIAVKERAEGEGILPMGPELTPAVQERLKKLIASGFCTEEEMNDKVKSKIRMLSEDNALAAIDELASVDRSRIRTFGSYFMGILNKRIRGISDGKHQDRGSSNDQNSRGRYGERRHDSKHRGDVHDRNFRESNRDSYRRERSRDRYDSNRGEKYRRIDQGRNLVAHAPQHQGPQMIPPPPPQPQGMVTAYGRQASQPAFAQPNAPQQQPIFASNNQQFVSSMGQSIQNPQLNRPGMPPINNVGQPQQSNLMQANIMQPQPQQSPMIMNQVNSAMNPQQYMPQQQLPQQMMQQPMGNNTQSQPPPPPPQQRPGSFPSQPNNNWPQSQQQAQGSWQSPHQLHQSLQAPPQQGAMSLDVLGLADQVSQALNQNRAQGPPSFSSGPGPNMQIPPPQQMSYSNSSMPFNNNTQQYNQGGVSHQNKPRRSNSAKLNELSPMVQYAVQNLQATGQVAPLDEGILGMVKDLPENLALSALQKFISLDKSTMRNTTAYLAGVLRKELSKINRR